MCVAIYKPHDGKITKKRLQEAYRANPDGWGFCKREEAVGNWLHFVKGTSSFNTFYDYYRRAKGRQKDDKESIVIHFRTASSGNIHYSNCHPFSVHKNLLFVENGNLFHYSNYFYEQKDEKTDIQRFNDDILKKLPKNFLSIPEIRKALEDYCKSNLVKMIFLDTKEGINIINEPAGEWIDGCWYSNGGIKNYIGYGYSGAYYYHADDVRHKGGMISNMMFPKRLRSNWIRCGTCGGYFYKLQEENCNDCNIFLKLKGYCN